jgi:hypothetical protein
MSETRITPEQALFQHHLESGAYRSGVARKRWRLVSCAWPYPIFAVRAADGVEYGLRFDCTGYGATEATARPWDIERDAPLAFNLWPTGRSRIPLAFNPAWKAGSCLYLPCDRNSLPGHVVWTQQHPNLLWDRKLGVVSYLRVVSDMLNSGDYGGRRAA